MARQTFFSFYYNRDVWRANQVRNSWVTKDDKQAAGFLDAAAFEEVEKKGEDAVKKWIDDQLKGTSVTVVLIGTETSTRPYVRYEIEQSHKRGNGMFGIYIHNMKDNYGKTDTKGTDPFSAFKFTNAQGTVVTYPTYDWVSNDGYKNMSDWIEAAAKKAGR